MDPGSQDPTFLWLCIHVTIYMTHVSVIYPHLWWSCCLIPHNNGKWGQLKINDRGVASQNGRPGAKSHPSHDSLFSTGRNTASSYHHHLAVSSVTRHITCHNSWNILFLLLLLLRYRKRTTLHYQTILFLQDNTLTRLTNYVAQAIIADQVWVTGQGLPNPRLLVKSSFPDEKIS